MVSSDEFSDDAQGLIATLLDSDATPRPRKTCPTTPLRRTRSPSAASSKSSQYLSASEGEGNSFVEPLGSRAAPLRATRSQTRELGRSDTGAVTHATFDIPENGDSPRKTISIDFSVAFAQALMPHLQTRNLPEPIWGIADDLCRAWDARWVLHQAKVPIRDARFKQWKAQSLELINVACSYTRLWPADRLNRVFALTKLIMDADPDWDMPDGIRYALPGTTWSGGGSQYAPSNMIAQSALWSPVNEACAACRSVRRVTVCTVLAGGGGKCYACIVRRLKCSHVEEAMENEIVVYDSSTGATGDTWEMAMEKGSRRPARIASAAHPGSMADDTLNTGASKSAQSKGKKRKKASGTSSQEGDTARAANVSRTFSWETETDDDSEESAALAPYLPLPNANITQSIKVFNAGPARRLVAHVSADKDGLVDDPMVYRPRPDGEEPARPMPSVETKEESLKELKNVVMQIGVEFRQMMDREERIASQTMRDIAAMAEERKHRKSDLPPAGAHHCDRRGAANDEAHGDPPGPSRPSPDERTRGKGKGTIPALRIGPWDNFRQKDTDISELVDTLISELPHGYDLVPPTSVRPGKNPRFVFACFEDVENRDNILSDWRRAGGKYTGIPVQEDMVSRSPQGT